MSNCNQKEVKQAIETYLQEIYNSKNKMMYNQNNHLDKIASVKKKIEKVNAVIKMS